MWLLNTDTLELSEFIGTLVPPYAILSHTWGLEEVSFVEMKKPKYRERIKQKAGFSKIEGCCTRAKQDGYTWVWVDTCCIDKRSSAELSEAINSMFRWYQCSRVCYVYLPDVPGGDYLFEIFANSKWFTRGWTLQELLAPRDLVFFAQDWTVLGYVCAHPLSRHLMEHGGHLNLTEDISSITRIPEDFVLGYKRLEQACVSQRMFWASSRKTTRPEDQAYSLMGLFDVNMPTLYGEGLEKAFMRLQQEIFSSTTDQSILAWHYSAMTSYRLFADSPACFQNSGNVIRSHQGNPLAPEAQSTRSAFHMTNLGLRITLLVYTPMNITDRSESKNRVEANLHCFVDENDGIRRQICLNLSYMDTDIGGRTIYMCKRSDSWTFSTQRGDPTSIFIRGISYENSTVGQHIPFPISSETSHLDNVRARSLDLIATATCFPRESLRDGITFSDLDIDSLLVLDIIWQIKEELGIQVGHWDFYGNPTVEGFVKFLCSKVEEKSIE